MKTKEFYRNNSCICDRCGDMFTLDPLKEDLIIYRKKDVGEGFSKQLVHFDLCPECSSIVNERIETEMDNGKYGDISFWEEFQHMCYDATNAQAEEAIKILQEKLKKKDKLILSADLANKPDFTNHNRTKEICSIYLTKGDEKDENFKF